MLEGMPISVLIQFTEEFLPVKNAVFQNGAIYCKLCPDY